MTRRGRTALKTVSVRMGDVDVNRLAQLKEALQGAHRNSYVGGELAGVRGTHAAYDAPVGDGHALRWALKFALEHLPVDLMDDPRASV